MPTLQEDIAELQRRGVDVSRFLPLVQEAPPVEPAQPQIEPQVQQVAAPVSQPSIEEDIAELRRRGIDVSRFDQLAQQPERKGLFQRVGEDVSKRAAQIQSIRKGEIGDQTRVEDVLQQAGAVAGGLGDIAGEAIVSGLRGVSAITPDFIEEPIKDIAQDLGEAIIQTDVGKFGLKALSKGVEAYNDFKEKHPRAARNIEATFNVGALIAPVKGKPKISKTFLSGGAEKAKKLAQKITPKRAKTLTSDDVRNLSRIKYEEAAKAGGSLKPEVINEFLKTVDAIPTDSPAKEVIDRLPSIKALRQQAQKNAPTVTRTRDPLTGIVKTTVTPPEKISPLTLFDAQTIDEALGEVKEKFVTPFGAVNKTGFRVGTVQDKLNDLILNATDKDILNKKGFDKLKEAKQLWARKSKLQSIEKIITRSEFAEQPASSLRSGFSTLLQNKKKLRGFTEPEIKAIRKAAKTGIVEEILRIPGSRLFPIVGGASGGVPGAVATFGISMAARQARNKLQLNKTKKLYEMILSGNKSLPKGTFSSAVTKKMSSLGGLSADSLAKTLRFIDDALVKTNNTNLLNNLRLDRAAILEVMENLGQE